MKDLMIEKWAEETATNGEMQRGFSVLKEECLLLSPTVDTERAREAYERYLQVTVDETCKVKLVMAPVLIVTKG